MKKLTLTKDKVALVDDSWFEYLNQWGWEARRDVRTDTWYALRYEYTDKKNKVVMMHNVIANPPKGMEVDHIDHDGLNNQDYNLRVCTHQQNSINRRIQSNNTSGYKGVIKSRKKWIAQIWVNGEWKYLGTHLTKIDAAIAYNDAAVKYHGEYAKLNDLSQ